MSDKGDIMIKHSRKYLLLLFLVFFFIGCQRSEHEVPHDFYIQLDWNTGALPPQYYYTYSVSIDSLGNGTFSYHPGYEDDISNDWKTGFSLAEEQVDDLYKYLDENDLLRNDWQSGQPLLGGKGTGITITTDGRQYAIPSVSELAEKDRRVVNNAIDFVNSLVEQDIWDEMETRQEAYEQAYSEND